MARYQFVRRLGQGAYTVVHLAREVPPRKDSPPRALKMLLPAFVDNVFHSKRFEREVRLSEGLSHPNFVRTLDHDELLGQLIQVMEHLDGVPVSTLLEAMKRVGLKVPPGEVCFIVEQVGQGLGYLLEEARRGAPFVPSMGPRNIVLTRKGEVKLTAYGRTRTTEELPDRMGPSPDGTVYATLEQIRNESDNLGGDAKALASLLCRLLLGARDDRDPAKRLRRLRSSGAPEPLTELVARTLDAQHPRRVDSVVAFLEALADARDDLGLQCSRESLSTFVCMQVPMDGAEDENTVTYVPHLGAAPAARAEPITSPGVPIVAGKPLDEPAATTRPLPPAFLPTPAAERAQRTGGPGAPPADDATVIRRPKLGELLRLQGKVDPVLLEQAAAEARAKGRRLGDVLREQKLVQHEDLLRALGHQVQEQYILDDALAEADPGEAVRLLLPQDARRLRALPLAEVDGELVLAMEDPLDEDALGELRRLTGHARVRGAFASPAALDEAWRRFYLAASEPTHFDLQIDVQQPVSSSEPTMIVQVEKVPGRRKGPG